MNFIKLGKRYINLDAIASVVPRKKRTRLYREFYRRHANGYLRNGYGRHQKSFRNGIDKRSRS